MIICNNVFFKNIFYIVIVNCKKSSFYFISDHKKGLKFSENKTQIRDIKFNP